MLEAIAASHLSLDTDDTMADPHLSRTFCKVLSSWLRTEAEAMLSDKLEVKRQSQALLFQDWEFFRKAMRNSSPPVFPGPTVASWVDREENAVVGPVTQFLPITNPTPWPS